MSKLRKVAAGGFGILAVGYALGILTAPQSGKQTRKDIKDKATNSVSDLERDLKTIYSQTKATLDKLAKDNPKLSDKIKTAKTTAQKSQIKIRDILTAIHGRDNVDDDLEVVLLDAKIALNDLKDYLKK